LKPELKALPFNSFNPVKETHHLIVLVIPVNSISSMRVPCFFDFYLGKQVSYKIVDHFNIAFVVVRFCRVYRGDFSSNTVFNVFSNEVIFEVNFERCFLIFSIQV
jgi:hypothetical protein